MIINYDDVLDQLRARGLIIEDRQFDLDGRIQRWKVENEGREKRGWTRLREWTSAKGNRYIVGSYGVWHGTDDGYTKIEFSKTERAAMSPEDLAAKREADKAARRAVDDRRKAEAKTAAEWSAIVWAHAKPCTEHDYLAGKGVKPHGLRVLIGLDGIQLPDIDESNWYRLSKAVEGGHSALVVPMHDVHGNVNGIQFIYGKGHPRRAKLGKEFWPTGMAMGGTFGVIGPVNRAGVLLVAEGYVTAASLHEATGHSVAYAFSANNLGKAGKLLRKQYKVLRLLFCADDDYLTPGNPGVTACSQATAEIEGSAWVKPDFTDPETGKDRRPEGAKLSDYNDLAVLTGVPLVLANQINAKLDELKWREAGQRAGPIVQGGGENVADDTNGRRRARSVMSLDELIERFVPIDDGTGKYVWDTWTLKMAAREQMITLLPAGVRGDDIKRHPVWALRGAYYIDEIGFDPSGQDTSVKLNTWRGWPMAPKEGECSHLLDTIYWLCGDEPNKDEVYNWLLCWMAWPLQHPGAKLSSAVIMHGPQGTGKTTVFQTLAKIYGDYSTVLNQRGIEDKFNSDWADSRLFILAEEVVTRAEMWHIKNELKDLVTGEWIRVNPKNIAAYRQRNQVNIVYLSNENQPLPLENDDRRHLVVYNPPAQNDDYYDRLYAELENGGVEAFYWHLLHNVDTSAWHPKKRPPMTRAKASLVNLSKPSEFRFIDDWLDGQTEWPICPCQSSDFYAAYLRWCRTNGESRPRPSNHFHTAIARQEGWEKNKVRVYDNTHYTGSTIPKMLTIPPGAVLEAVGHGQPADKTRGQWLTDAWITFNNAINGHENGGAQW